MKKIICALIALMLLVCGLALAEGKTIKPMAPEIDLAAPADGIYYVAFAPADLADGALKCTIYTEDHYDIVDIATLEKGDTIRFGDETVVIEALERGDALLINGGNDEGGFTLQAFDEDNCWKAVTDDDYATWTDSGEITLPLAGNVTFTDGWDIEKEPATFEGAEAVAQAINNVEMDYFSYLNTHVRVEGGQIVEIVRSYMP